MNSGPFKTGRSRVALCASAAVALAAVFFFALARPLNAQTSLEAGMPLERTLQPGEHHRYSIALDSDVCAHVIFATEATLTVTLGRPGAPPVAVIDNASEENAPQPVTIVAQTAGVYSIDVSLGA